MQRSVLRAYERIDDGQLVSLTQQGSEGAFGELVRRHNKTMLQVALRILGDRQDAEDELQNAWWKAWRHLSAFAGDSRFTTWMTRIVMNQCLMRLRQTQPRAVPLYGRGRRPW